mmetsp:Transcript_20973/g.29544  ORF Transcript_20973/g.29544 Transcript_20973/m.29544 type:complete len:150 (-) Transcript_20973:734-1183(-)
MSDKEAIKSLGRKKSNRNCFDCRRVGPHNNVNLTHGTFVCSSCAGLHRALGHRVNTINMTSFTEAEQQKMKKIGNKRAALEWFGKLSEDELKTIDLTNNSAIRKFIDDTYKEKKWHCSPEEVASAKKASKADKEGKEKKKKKDKKKRER